MSLMICPPDATLNAFHQGNLPPDEIDQIADHLETCANCEERLQELEGQRNTMAAQLQKIRKDDPPRETVEFSSQASASDPTLPSAPLVGGRYRLVERIGEGGMGVVYMARQVEPVRRLVAVKLIRSGLDGRMVLARFEAERQALALMDHPNIARALDAGAEPSGRPYFVMELVKGPPITIYCDEKRLATRERLELFVSVCRAVQHAHQKGIIHRDLKPSNVLVASYDGEPVPKVIDFGIAKAVDQSLTDRTLVTGFGAVVGTPEYMSPEQAEPNQLDIDTRSDVYALGVILYELLTGSTPLDLSKARDTPVLEILRRIREDETPRPSNRLSSSEKLASLAERRRAEPKRLAILVRGDLDWIVMRALEKDRSRRYETADALARDIERHLAGERVDASPPSSWDRIRRTMRRRPKLVAGLSAAVAVGVIALGGMLARETVLNRRLAVSLKSTRAAEKVADKRLDQAMKSVKAYYTGISGDFLLQQTEFAELRSRLLEEPRKFYAEIADDLAHSPTDDPRAQTLLAEGYSSHGKILVTLERRAEGEADLLKALKIARDLVASYPRDPAYRILVAETALIYTKSISDRFEEDRGEKVDNLIRESLDALKAIPAHRDDPEVLILMAQAHSYKANDMTNRTKVKREDVDREFIESIKLATQAAKPGGGKGVLGMRLAKITLMYASYLISTARYEKCMDQVNAGLAAFDKCGLTQTEQPSIRLDRINALAHLSTALSKIPGDHLEEAEATYRRSIALAEEAVKLRPNDRAWRWAQLRAYSRFGEFLAQIRKYDEAESMILKAVADCETLGSEARARYMEVELRTILCIIYHDANKMKESLAAARILVEKSDSNAKGSKLASFGFPAAQSRRLLATLYIEMGDSAAAITPLRESYDWNRDYWPTNPQHVDAIKGTSSTATALAVALREVGKFDEAVKVHEESITLIKLYCDKTKSYERVATDVADSLAEYASTLLKMGNFAEALAKIREAKTLLPFENRQGVVAGKIALCLTFATDPEILKTVGDEVIASLGVAIARKPAEARLVAADPVFKPIHDREDYRTLIGKAFDKGFPADPFIPAAKP